MKDAPSLWQTLAPPAPSMPPLRGERRCDVAVVGGGFLGLSTALHLAEAGASVVVVEAETAGFGASGRNTGFVVPALKSTLGPADVEAAIGPAHAERLVDLVGGSGRHLFDLVRRHAIACDAEETGWMQPAHTADVARILEARVGEWHARGRTDVCLLDGRQTEARLGIAGYPAALMIPTGGQLNPLAYARGLARAAIAAGAAVHAASRVTAMAPAAGGWRLRTLGGSVRAERVLLATNALVGELAPAVRDAVIPVRVHQVATQPLGAEACAAILPGRQPASDTRRHTFAVRWSPDGRLVTGGLVIGGPGAARRAARKFVRRLAAFFPDNGPFDAAHVWSGVIAVLPSSLPAFFSLAPGLDAAIGCNGRGVALTTALGHVLAGHYAGQIAAGDLPLPFRPATRAPNRRFAAIGPSLWLPWSELRDRLETGRPA